MWAWFLTTKAGRYCVAGAAIALAIFAVVLRLLAMGRAQEKATQTQARLKAISQKRTSDEKVDGLGPAAVGRELDKWMRDGKR